MMGGRRPLAPLFPPILGVGLVLGGCGQPAPPAVIPTTIPYLPTPPTSQAVSVSVQAFTNQNWGTAATDPAKYVGSTVSLTGQVFNVEHNETRVGLQMWTDPLRAEGNTVVVFPREGFPEVASGDRIEIEGKLVGVFEGKTDAGAVLKLPRVEATSVRVLSKGVQASPTAAVAGATVRAATPTPAPSPTATPRPVAPGLFRVAGTGSAGLTVRANPSLTGRKLGVVHDNGTLQVVAQAAPGWAQVRGDGFSGYVATGYLSGPLPASSRVVLAKLSPR